MSWPISRLGEVISFIRGVTFTPEDQVEPFSEGSTVVMRTKNVQVAGLDQSDLIAVPSGFVRRKEQELREGDILVSSANSWELVGKASYVPKLTYEATAGGFISIVRAEESRIDSRYLYHWVACPATQHKIRHCGRQTTNISNLDVGRFQDLEVPLPPLPEQKRIAAILDKADAIRCKRHQAIQLADDFLRAVFLDMFGDPATNPKAWPVYKMSEVIDFKGGSQPPKETFEYEEKEGYVRLVQIRDFRTDKFKTYIPLRLARRRFEADDVMIGRYGPPVFQILRGLSGSYNVALMKAVPRSGVTKDFVYRLLQLPTYQNAVISNSERTAGQSGVNLDLLNSLDVPLPPVDVQIAMSQKIRKTEGFIRRLRVQLEDAEQLFSSLSQSAFSGDL